MQPFKLIKDFVVDCSHDPAGWVVLFALLSIIATIAGLILSGK